MLLWVSHDELKFAPNFKSFLSVIQNKYRSYCENKRFKQSLTTGCDSAVSSNLDTCGSTKTREPNNVVSKENTQNTSGLKRTYSQSTQNQAARKIQQFMLTAKNK